MNEWISVDDQLPEANTDVLVYAIGKANGFVGQSVMVVNSMSDHDIVAGRKCDKHWRIPWPYFFSDYKITHWTPLPQPPQPNYSCSKCKYALKLVKYDYSNKGCEHTDMDGFCCLAMAHEGVATWMVGNDINTGFCECYQPKDWPKPEVTTFDGM